MDTFPFNDPCNSKPHAMPMVSVDGAERASDRLLPTFWSSWPVQGRRQTGSFCFAPEKRS